MRHLCIALFAAITVSTACVAGTADKSLKAFPPSEDGQLLQFSGDCCEIERNLILNNSEIQPLLSLSPDSSDVEVAVAKVDLNGDGKNDFVAQVYSRYTCGTKGCSTFVLLSNNNSYTKIPFNVVAGNKIKVVEAPSSDMKDMKIMLSDGQWRTWRWIKNSYQCVDCTLN